MKLNYADNLLTYSFDKPSSNSAFFIVLSNDYKRDLWSKPFFFFSDMYCFLGMPRTAVEQFGCDAVLNHLFYVLCSCDCLGVKVQWFNWMNKQPWHIKLPLNQFSTHIFNFILFVKFSDCFISQRWCRGEVLELHLSTGLSTVRRTGSMRRKRSGTTAQRHSWRNSSSVWIRNSGRRTFMLSWRRQRRRWTLTWTSPRTSPTEPAAAINPISLLSMVWILLTI